MGLYLICFANGMFLVAALMIPFMLTHRKVNDNMKIAFISFLLFILVTLITGSVIHFINI